MTERKSPVRTRRDELGKRAAEVAAAAGISVQSLWMIETGRTRVPGLDVARRLAAALDSDIDALFPPAGAGAAA